MLDDQADHAMEEVLQYGAKLIDALNLTPVEREYAMIEAQEIINHVSERYFDDKLMQGRKVRPIAVAAAVAFSLSYFDKWEKEITRKFPDLGKR